MARKKNQVMEWTVKQLMTYDFYPMYQGLKMTKYITRLKINWLRQLIWLFYYPLFVFVPLWWSFRNSPRFEVLQAICWDLGWNGIKDES